MTNQDLLFDVRGVDVGIVTIKKVGHAIWIMPYSAVELGSWDLNPAGRARICYPTTRRLPYM